MAACATTGCEGPGSSFRDEARPGSYDKAFSTLLSRVTVELGSDVDDEPEEDPNDGEEPGRGLAP